MEQRPSRSQVRRFSCPVCDAAPGDPCIGARGKVRTANHMERADLAGSGGCVWEGQPRPDLATVAQIVRRAEIRAGRSASSASPPG